MTDRPVTHEQLRKLAIQWLTNTMQCGVVLSEAVTATSEVPDAIGWRGCVSYVVECKISRSDFHAEKQKRHVRSGRGIGQFRYILCPDGVLQKKDMEGLDYGLLVWPGYKIFISTIKAATRRESCQDDEISMLVSALRRVRAREFLILVPENQVRE